MNYERMYYSIEDMDGEKVIHYLTSMSESGWVPDGWTVEEYAAQDETSVEITDYVWLYVKVSELQGISHAKVLDAFAYGEEDAKRYMSRVIAHEADEWIANQKDCDDVCITTVNEDTPYGYYQSTGWWMLG